MNKVVISLTAASVLALAGLFAVFAHDAVPVDAQPTPQEILQPTLLPVASNIPTSVRSPLQAAAYTQFLGLFGASGPHPLEPVAGFRSRIVKKPFGIYITPDTSPVQGDRFSGFHTGVDAEFTDTAGDVPVYAVADGTIVFRDWANGYGGVIVLRHEINGVPVFVLYGHMDPASFPAADIRQVRAGQQIAVLGDDHSHETDGVRKHIHFSIFTGEKLDLRGYVKTEAELGSWLNPLDFYPQ